MISFKRPTTSDIQQLLKSCKKVNYSYSEIGQSISEDQIAGYDNDLNKICLGKGKSIYKAGCEAINQWKMFPGGWAFVRPVNTPVEQDKTVVMIAKIFGVYWLNTLRIVFVLSDTGPVRRYGFAYGTLPQHVETGEELFSVEWLEDDTVWYKIRAFSRPRLWLVRLAYPLARFYQKRFVRESMQAMYKAVNAAKKG